MHVKQSTNSHLESHILDVEKLGMMGSKNWGGFVLTDAIEVQIYYITLPESSHAQPCDHRQSNYSQLNVCLFNPHTVNVVTALTMHLESQF